MLDDPWLRNPGDKKKSKLGKSFIEESKVEESKE
jgi:hypothetical protein